MKLVKKKLHEARAGHCLQPIIVKRGYLESSNFLGLKRNEELENLASFMDTSKEKK